MSFSALCLLLVLAVVVVVNGQQSSCTAYATQANCGAFSHGLRTSRSIKLDPCGSSSLRKDAVPFALVGDYGIASADCLQEVMQLLARIKADVFFNKEFEFVMTMGDNAYWDGSCESFQSSVGPYFGEYFTPGSSCTDPQTERTKSKMPSPSSPSSSRSHRTGKTGVAVLNTTTSSTRFFPSIGNHDWDTYQSYGDQLPYLQYFSYLSELSPSGHPPGQYYSVDPSSGGIPKGTIRLLALNSNLGQVSNGSDPASKKQKAWFETEVAASTATFNIAFFHHSPYTTAQHDPPATWMRWPFAEMGLSAVITGHEHTYERVELNATVNNTKRTVPFVVNGLGGHPWVYEITGPDCTPIAGSQVRYNKAHGIMVGVYSPSDSHSLDFCFYSTEGGGKLVDHFSVTSPTKRG